MASLRRYTARRRCVPHTLRTRVAEDSRTETFIAARLWVDTERWRGVPFLLRTGKQLATVNWTCRSSSRSPDLPRPSARRTARTALPLRTVPGGDPLPPYVRLIHDVLLGDRSLFTRPDGLEHVWQVVGALPADKPEPVIYPKGSWGASRGGPARRAHRVATQILSHEVSHHSLGRRHVAGHSNRSG
jgi:glucose-6-phosphate 1-dehydrogenase